MGEVVFPGRPPIAVALRRSARARRISLRVSGLDGRVSLTLPSWVAEAEGLGFVRQKEDWIRRQLARRTPDVAVCPGSVIPLEGIDHSVEMGAGRGVRPGQGRLIVGGAPETASARLGAYLRQRARDRLVEASDRYAEALGVGYGRITLRDTRSRWGSCSARGDLMYSWRLILAPPEVLDYVAAHEIAHRARMDHSPAFWAEVAALMPSYGAPRDWLRREGASLHRWRFGA